MGRTKKILMAAAAVTAVAAAGSAFTAGITDFPQNKVVGYGATTIVGATSTNVAYTYNLDRSLITSVAVTFVGDLDGATTGPDLQAYTFEAKWSDGGGTVIKTVDSGTGTLAVGTWDAGSPGTTVVTFTPAGGGVSTSGVEKFGVLVTADIDNS